MNGINTDLASMGSQRALSGSQAAVGQSVQRLSSGLRVNGAKDDAAGLAIAERFNSQVKGMNAGVRNANDAVSLAQTAEGALAKVSDMLQRLRELAVQSSNGSNSASDRLNLDAEFQQLGQAITRTIGGTRFNGANILAANAGTQAFQVGVGATSNDVIAITTTRLDNNSTITTVTSAGITSAALASAAINSIDTAIDPVTTERSNYGAAQNRFESAITVLQVSAENNAASRSRIMDADYATVTASLSRAQVLQQAGTAMLAQATQLPNQMLTLLR